jgi:hypothetical protein
MKRIGTDRGRTADRVATVRPADLHTAICDAALKALRDGAPAKLDGREAVQLLARQMVGQEAGERRREHLTAQIASQHRVARRARDNANKASSDDMRQDFMADVEEAYAERIRLQAELKALEEASEHRLLPESFASELDYVAHALAQLAATTTTPSREFGNAILDVIDGLQVVPAHDRTKCDVTFNLLLPFDGMVAQFGPIHTTVRNRAYPATLRDSLQGESPRSRLARRAHQHDVGTVTYNPMEVLQHVAMALRDEGYNPLAAGTLMRSQFEPLYDYVALRLWNDSVDQPLDSGYIDWLDSVYRDPNFRWNQRHHRVPAHTRQTLVDAILARDGEAAVPDLIADLRGSDVGPQQMAWFGRDISDGEFPPWKHCVVRLGDWGPGSSRKAKSLTLRRCICGDFATLVVRAPEVPEGVLCPTCHRMPRADSPTFPDAYFTGPRSVPGTAAEQGQ